MKKVGFFQKLKKVNGLEKIGSPQHFYFRKSSKFMNFEEIDDELATISDDPFRPDYATFNNFNHHSPATVDIFIN